MTDEELFSLVKISDEGAVTINNSIVCDGYDSNACAAVVSHIHSDHREYFSKCKHSLPIFASKLTMDMLEVLEDDTFTGRMQFNKMPYDEPKMIRCGSQGDLLTLYESFHVKGASQIFVCTQDNTRILYSGDISGVEKPPQCDVLILDSTHGSVSFEKPYDGESIERRFIDQINESINSGEKICIKAHIGKLQEIMYVVSKQLRGFNIKFIADETDIKLLKFYKNENHELPNVIASNTLDADDAKYGDFPYIEFRHTFEKTMDENRGTVTSFSFQGGYGKMALKATSSKSWKIEPKEHPQFKEILEYVNKASPKVVITENTRSAQGEILANELRENGFKARSFPIK